MAKPKRERKGYRVYRPTNQNGDVGYYAVEFKAHPDQPRPKRLKGFTDHAATDELARKLVRLVALRVVGQEPDVELSRWLDTIPARIREKLAQWDVIDHARFAAHKSLSDHLADFKAKMEADHRTPKHIAETIRMIEKVCDDRGFKTTSDISADALSRTVVQLLANGRSIRRANAVKTALKAFTKWLVEGGKLHADPLAGVRKGNVQTDRRRERRAFSVDEFDWLTCYVEQAPSRYGMSGTERALLYFVAVETGLRAGELRPLTASSCRLTDDQPHVLCKAKSTKNAKQARQYLRERTADALRGHLAHKAPTASVFGLPRQDEMVRMLRADLADARQAWIEAAKHDPDEQTKREQTDFLKYSDTEGYKLDFHSLRHTTGAWLAMAGKHPNVVKRLMRHSTITLTMDTYGHLFPGEEADAVNALPDMPSTQPDCLQATGTTDAAPDRLALRLAQTAGHDETAMDSIDRASPDDDSVTAIAIDEKATDTCGTLILNPPRLPIPPHRLRGRGRF